MEFIIDLAKSLIHSMKPLLQDLIKTFRGSSSDFMGSDFIIFDLILVTIVISLIGLSVTGPHKSNQPQKAVNVTKIFEKFGIPRNLWKTLISGKDDSTKIEEESNEKFSMNPYLKSKSYVAKHGGKMRTDEGNLFMGIVNWSGVAQSVVQGQK